MPLPVGVLGAGSFGTCLALLCSREHDVTIWARDSEIADAINREHRNPRYLTGIQLPENVRATGGGRWEGVPAGDRGGGLVLDAAECVAWDCRGGIGGGVGATTAVAIDGNARSHSETIQLVK